jgi:pyruvate dehydrogenase E2 component (dihydrolipoamide acetyltransferase)
METVMKMPDLATTDSAVTLVRWLVQPGQMVKRGQSLCEIETDKAASQLESIVTGVLKEYRVQPGDKVVVGQEIALFDTDTEAFTNADSPAAPAPAKRPGLFARNRAAAATPSQSPTPIPARAIALSQSQQAVGQRLQNSKQTIPHYYLQSSANAEPMIRRRLAGSPKPVWEAFFVVAIGKVLKDFERVRWRLDGDRAVCAPGTDIGVAIDVGGELFVAPIAAAPGASVEEVSNIIRARVGEIENGSPMARGIQPTAITITNLGDSCVESFAAIINPPEVAILAIGKIGPAPVVRERRIAIQDRVALTLSADHRVLNGKYAADFLGAIIREIESF